jgi:hypothetical protein
MWETLKRLLKGSKMTPEATPPPPPVKPVVPPQPIAEHYPSEEMTKKYSRELQASAMYTNYNMAIGALYQRARKHEKKQEWSRDYPKDAVLDDGFKLAPEVRKALMVFKATNPYTCPNEKFLDGVQQLYVDLSHYYEIPTPLVRHIGPWEGTSGSSYYTPHSITLMGYRSIITALHEYTHARGYGETAAVWWSTNAFRLVWPSDFKKLRASQNLPFKPREAVKSDEQSGS